MIVEILKNEHFQGEKDFPRRGTEKSTGFDVIATSEPKIVGERSKCGKWWSQIDYIEYETSLHIAPQSVSRLEPYKIEEIIFDCLAFPRSSVRKYNLTLSNCVGLIDNDYRNSIKVCFNYNFQPKDLFSMQNGEVVGDINMNKIYKKGDKICQLKFTEAVGVQFKLVDKLSDTDRGMGGFGSTGN
jgi:dUTPase